MASRSAEVEDVLGTEAAAVTHKRLASLQCEHGPEDPHPVHHRRADEMRAHGSLCLLVTRLIWNLRVAWQPLERFAQPTPPRRTALELIDLPTR